MIDTMIHYTYCIVFPTIPRLYIGVRSYNGPPSQDDYRSSSQKVKNLIKDGLDFHVHTIGTFATRKELKRMKLLFMHCLMLQGTLTS